jgi:hypothetical protein
MLTTRSIVLRDFTLYDRYNNVVLEGKVSRIDENGAILQVDGQYYRVGCGEYLYPALDNPLSKKEVQSLGLVKAGP